MATKAYCTCGYLLRWSVIPNDIEWSLVSKNEFDQLPDPFDLIDLAVRSKMAILCPQCHHLWVHWREGGKAPHEYSQIFLGEKGDHVPSPELIFQDQKNPTHFSCSCGNLLIGAESAESVEWRMVFDMEQEDYPDYIPKDYFYTHSRLVLPCTKCNHIWVFWDGDQNPQEYDLVWFDNRGPKGIRKFFSDLAAFFHRGRKNKEISWLL